MSEFLSNLPGMPINAVTLHRIENEIHRIKVEAKNRGYESASIDDAAFPWGDWQKLHEYLGQVNRRMRPDD